ncbi:MAG: hypothetical protein EZS28_028665, partial [Streblomastix strix]
MAWANKDELQTLMEQRDIYSFNQNGGIQELLHKLMTINEGLDQDTLLIEERQ